MTDDNANPPAANPTSSPAASDVAIRFHFTTCPTCGLAFGLPLALHLQRRADGGAVTCPNGHAHPILSDGQEDLDGRWQAVELADEVMNLRHQLRDAEARVAVLSTVEAEVTDRKEIKRRAGILAGRAERDEGRGFGFQVCPVCGESKRSNALASHLRTRHEREVGEMPAAAFPPIPPRRQPR